MADTPKYNLVAENPRSTVVAEYTPDTKERAERYQSEADLERAFIEQLKDQAYEHVDITTTDDLISNLRRQLEKLNRIRFTDSEWEQFFESEIANPNHGPKEKARTIQEDYVKILERENGTERNVRLLDKDNVHDNSLQVINQYEAAKGTRPNRYDVSVLVNGLPLVHIELKRRGVAIREAFNQIQRYQRDSFWAESGLFEYVQIFVISNGTQTKYYSNTTRTQHLEAVRKQARKKGKCSSNSFEFTSWWADRANRQIPDLMDFARTFFAKHTLLSILTRYCVFTADQELLAMRPYQIEATEKILNKIDIAENSRTRGTVRAGGYVWHTTGSGKTLTSFKAAQLASRLQSVDKVLFVVDRKDLDYQTMREYDKFEKGAANSNSSVRVLKRQLEDPNARIIITTIQKLDHFIKNNRGHAIFGERIVLIFDECHRSQFGEMHAAITKAFRNYCLFGFTGTPIFAANAAAGGQPGLKTTGQAFGDKLHTYTIVNAITDRNVLPFKVDYVSTMREARDIEDEQVRDIDREAALAAPQRIENVVGYIRKHFNQKTRRSKRYKLRERSLRGFNSMFAVSSIDAARKYYSEFRRQQQDALGESRLKVATIYSFCVNEDLDGMVDENPEDTSSLDQSSRDFLDDAIADYNRMFGTSFDTSSDKFQNYYKDVSQRVKDREIDLLIVVNMFLTGFDATTLNTLWVDKNLRLHGLLQAYSRTNRILNSVKTFGNIVSFRNLEQATNESIALFGDEDARGLVLLKSYDEYYRGYRDGDRDVPGYADMIAELQEKSPLDQQIVGEQNQKDFIRLYGTILRRLNILTAFDEFAGNEILSERDFQDYRSRYLDLYEQFRKDQDAEKENINDDIVFEMELIKQVEINIDYILELVRQYHEKHTEDQELRLGINKAIDASINLRNKKDLINQFIESLTPDSSIDSDWKKFVGKKRKEDLDELIASENLDPEETYIYVRNSFQDGYVSEAGTALTKVLPAMSRFTAGGERTKKRESVLAKMRIFFEKFFDISDEDL